MPAKNSTKTASEVWDFWIDRGGTFTDVVEMCIRDRRAHRVSSNGNGTANPTGSKTE